jgi:hypothetical protein
MQFPLARFLDRFGITLTVIIAVVVSIGIVGVLLSSWKGLADAEQRLVDNYRESKKAEAEEPQILGIHKPDPAISPSFALGLLLTGIFGLLLYAGLKALSPLHEKVVTGTVFIATLATVLFWVKLKRLFVYAVMEIAAALFLAGQTMARLKDDVAPIEMLTLLTSAYLVVRGLDNLRNGMTAQKKMTEPQ